MTTSELRSTVLLGAGASVDAGVPISVGLTRKIAEIINEPRSSALSNALNTAIGAMVAHDTARGGGAYDGIDVERLFSAVEMLSDRDSLEIAPFVANWNPSLDELAFTSRMPSFWGSNFKREIAGSFDSGLERVFAEGVRALTRNGGSGGVFARLGQAMVAALEQCLVIEAGSSDYLAPLGQLTPRPGRVATLNYDRGVELMGESTGQRISTGITEWDGGNLSWGWDPTADVQLLKLHGSLDWRVVVENDRDGHVVDAPPRLQKLSERRFATVDRASGERPELGELGVVFGQRGKLRSEGPFLAMFAEFERWLSETDRLIVIGYSFRDDHINSLIRRWFNRGPIGGLCIIDPAFPASVHGAGRGDFRRDLWWAMHRSVSRGYELLRPHQILRDSAKEGIAHVVGRFEPPTGR